MFLVSGFVLSIGFVIYRKPPETSDLKPETIKSGMVFLPLNKS